jgi:CO dehydrogenase nickel-insertion accessory protein CooC1
VWRGRTTTEFRAERIRERVFIHGDEVGVEGCYCTFSRWSECVESMSESNHEQCEGCVVVIEMEAGLLRT